MKQIVTNLCLKHVNAALIHKRNIVLSQVHGAWALDVNMYVICAYYTTMKI